MSNLLHACGVNEKPLTETYIFCAEECDNIDRLNYSLEEILSINEKKVTITDNSVDGSCVDILVEEKCFECIPVECILTENEFYNLKSEDVICGNVGSIDRYRLEKLYGNYLNEATEVLFSNEKKELSRASIGLGKAEKRVKKLLRLLNKTFAKTEIRVEKFDIGSGDMIIKIKTNIIWADEDKDTKIKYEKVVDNISTTKTATTFTITKGW